MAGFVGRATTEPLVVACSVEKDALEAKIRGDDLGAALLDTERDAVNGSNFLAGPATPEDFDEAVGFDGKRHGYFY